MPPQTFNPLIPATPTLQNGVLFSPQYGDVYHSTSGAIEQCRAVFLAGNGLPGRWAEAPQFQILETGFGIGLNFLVTWQTWCAETRRPDVWLHYVALEQSPLDRQSLSEALSRHPALAHQAAALIEAWPVLTPGIQRLTFASDRVTLTLAFGDATRLLPELSLWADAVYLDGFAPSRNPDLWSPFLLRQVARQCRHGATLASWCVAGGVRRSLEQVGFRTLRAPGFGPKRHRLEAHFDKIPAAAHAALTARARPPVAQSLERVQRRDERHALVIGAGLAGCQVSESLVRRGWRVTLIDQGAGPATRASGNRAGILRPHLSLDDNPAARLGRNGFFATLRGIQRWQNAGKLIEGGWHGALELARDPAEALRQQTLVERFGFPPVFVEILDAPMIRERFELDAPRGGLFYSQAGWVAPRSLCQAALDACADALTLHWNRTAILQRRAGRWQALDPSRAVIAEASVAILATGDQLTRQPECADWPLEPWSGQVSRVARDPFLPGTPVLCQPGYLIPGVAGELYAGATYEQGPASPPDIERRRANLEPLLLLKKVFDPAKEDLDGDRVAVRTISRDRLPVIGALPGTEEGYVVGGLGSHGLLWGSLAAELIGAMLEGEPLPLEKSLLRAISPARYVGSRDPSISRA